MFVAAARDAGTGFRITWTPQSDQRLAKMREQGMSMRCMARSFGLSRSVITARARILGLEIPNRPALAPQKPPPSSDAGREPLPAGHALTWGLITQGTCLEGSLYTPPNPIQARYRHQASENSNLNAGET